MRGLHHILLVRNVQFEQSSEGICASLISPVVCNMVFTICDLVLGSGAVIRPRLLGHHHPRDSL